MVVKRNRLKEVLATMRGFFWLLSIAGSIFIIFGVISLGRILSVGPHEVFILGHTQIPKWQGAGATNIGVFIMCSVGFLAVLVAILLRYRQHKELLEYFRSRGETDVNNDGKVDSFADRFLDDM